MNLKIVNIRGFDGWNADYITNQIMQVEMSSQPAHIFDITSPGGYVFALSKICDVLDSCKKPTIGVASGMCASCGSIFLSSMNYRICGPNSEILLHEPSNISWGKYSDQKADLKSMKDILDWMYKKYDKSANKPDGYFEDLINKNNNADFTMTAKEALSHNFIDATGSLLDVIKNLDNIVAECKKKKR